MRQNMVVCIVSLRFKLNDEVIKNGRNLRRCFFFTLYFGIFSRHFYFIFDCFHSILFVLEKCVNAFLLYFQMTAIHHKTRLLSARHHHEQEIHRFNAHILLQFKWSLKHTRGALETNKPKAKPKLSPFGVVGSIHSLVGFSFISIFRVRLKPHKIILPCRLLFVQHTELIPWKENSKLNVHLCLRFNVSLSNKLSVLLCCTVHTTYIIVWR